MSRTGHTILTDTEKIVPLKYHSIATLKYYWNQKFQPDAIPERRLTQSKGIFNNPLLNVFDV